MIADMNRSWFPHIHKMLSLGTVTDNISFLLDIPDDVNTFISVVSKYWIVDFDCIHYVHAL